MASLGSLVVNIGANLSGLRDGLNSARESIQGASGKLNAIGKKTSGVGKNISAGLSLPMAGLGALILKAGSDFDGGMAEVQAISGATAKDLEKLRKKAKEMGSTTKFSATESAEALKYMALAGWDTEKMLGGIDGVMNLASASGEDLATVSDILTDSMTGFKLEASESSKFADLLAMTSAKSNTNISMLGEAFKYASPLAGALGVSAEDTALALGSMANAGIKSSMAGTSMRTMMTSLSIAMEDANSNYAKLGINIEKTEDGSLNLKGTLDNVRTAFATMTPAQKASNAEFLVGKNSMTGLLAITDANAESYNGLALSLANSSGKASEMSGIMSNTLGGQLKQMGSALEGVALQFAEILIPILMDFMANVIQPLIKWFASLSGGSKKVMVVIGLIAVAIGPLLIAFGMIATAISTLLPILGLISLKMGLIVGAIALVVGALILLWNTNDTFRNAVLNAWEMIKKGFEIAKQVVITVLSKIMEFWNQHKDQIMETVNAIMEFIRTLFEVVFEKIWFVVQFYLNIIKDFWDEWGTTILAVLEMVWALISTVFSQVFSAITTAFKIFTAVLEGDWSRVWDLIKEYLKTSWENIKKIFNIYLEAFKKIFTLVLGKIVTAVENDFNRIKTFISTTMSNIKTTWANIWDAIKLKITNIMTSIKNTIKPVIDWIMDKISAMKNAFESAKKIAGEVGGGIKGAVGGAKNLVSKIIPFASGGVVTKPTLGLVGEAGSEAVIPLKDYQNLLMGQNSTQVVNGSVGGMGNINVTVELDSYVIARKTAPQMVKQLRLQGV